MRIVNYSFNSIDHHHFNVFFQAANGSWTQLLHERMVDGQWVSASRVITQWKGELNPSTRDIIDSKYPEKIKDWDNDD
jgi:hypothetical protein